MPDPDSPSPGSPDDRGLGAWLYRHAYVFALVAVTALVIVEWLHRPSTRAQTAVGAPRDGGAEAK